MPESSNHARQSPTPSNNTDGSDLRSIAGQVNNILDDDGHFNPDPGKLSRGHPDHPDYIGQGGKNTPGRDDRGRFQKKDAASPDGLNTLDTGSDDFTDDQKPFSSDDQDADTSDAGDTADDLNASADADAESNDGETESIETLNELASALDLSPEEFKAQITHTFKAADTEVTVTLAELEAGYQKDADYRRQTQNLAEGRRVAEAVYQNKMREFEQQNALAAQNFGVTEQIIAAELNDPRLAELRHADPAEWSARREEITNKIGAIRSAQQHAAANHNHFKTQHLTGLRQREQEALSTAIPDWSDNHRKLAEATMSSIGYSQDEVGQIFDHRLVVAALELAVLRNEVSGLREQKNSATDAVKRVKKEVPKFQKPGKQRLSGARVKKDSLAKLRKNAQNSGSVGDAAKVIEHLL